MSKYSSHSGRDVGSQKARWGWRRGRALLSSPASKRQVNNHDQDGGGDHDHDDENVNDPDDRDKAWKTGKMQKCWPPYSPRREATRSSTFSQVSAQNQHYQVKQVKMHVAWKYEPVLTQALAILIKTEPLQACDHVNNSTSSGNSPIPWYTKHSSRCYSCLLFCLKVLKPPNWSELTCQFRVNSMD